METICPVLLSNSTATEPECDYPEAMGDDYGDDDLPDMGDVSIQIVICDQWREIIRLPL